jgi:hypothetical protein
MHRLDCISQKSLERYDSQVAAGVAVRRAGYAPCGSWARGGTITTAGDRDTRQAAGRRP